MVATIDDIKKAETQLISKRNQVNSMKQSWLKENGWAITVDYLFQSEQISYRKNEICTLCADHAIQIEMDQQHGRR